MKVFGWILIIFSALNAAALAALIWASILGYHFETGNGSIFAAIVAIAGLSAVIGGSIVTSRYYSK
jgi:hypothetical protein